MRVQEVIEALSHVDPDLEVCLYDDEMGDVYDANQISTEGDRRIDPNDGRKRIMVTVVVIR